MIRLPIYLCELRIYIRSYYASTQYIFKNYVMVIKYILRDLFIMNYYQPAEV